MYVHRWIASDRLWSVGWLDADGQFHATSDHDQEEEAAAKVAQLNGSGVVLPSQSLEAIVNGIKDGVVDRVLKLTFAMDQARAEADRVRQLLADVVRCWDGMKILGCAVQNPPLLTELMQTIETARTVLPQS